MEATGNLIGIKNLFETSVSKKFAMELHTNDEAKEDDAGITTHKKR